MKPVVFGILGASKFAINSIIPALLRVPNARFGAIASRNVSKAKQIVSNFEDVKVYDSYDALIQSPHIDVVYIPLPNHMHVSMATYAAQSGKHVLVEKPIGINYTEAETLLEVSQQTGKIIQEGFMVYTSTQWMQVKALINEGTIGDLRGFQLHISYSNTDANDIRNQTATGGGILNMAGCYFPALAWLLFEQPPQTVYGAIHTDERFGVDYLTSAILTYPQAQAIMMVSSQMVQYQRATIFGTIGSIELPIPITPIVGQAPKIIIDNGSTLGGTSQIIEESDATDQYEIEIARFIEAVQGKRPPVLSLQHSLDILKITDAIRQSAKNGEQIKFLNESAE